jgi:hypothetical protein
MASPETVTVELAMETPTPAFDPKEQWKMDYQAALDKAKIDYAYKFSWKALLWDKGVFGLVVGLCVALAVVGTNWAMESYKLKESHRRFLAEKRLESLIAVSGAVTEMTGPFFMYADPTSGEIAEKADAEYAAGIDRTRNTVNRNLPLLGPEFDRNLSLYIQVHRSFQAVGVKKCDAYRDWASELDNEFTAMCKAYMESDEFPKANAMALMPIPYKERIGMTPQQYIEAQLGYWNAARKANDGK